MTGISNRLNNVLAELNDVNNAEFWQKLLVEVNAAGSSELFNGLSRFKQIEIKILPGNLNGSIFVEDVQMLLQDTNQEVSFHFAIKMSSGGIVSVVITDVNTAIAVQSVTTVNIGQSDAVVNASGLASPEWTIIRTEPIILQSQENPNLIPSVNIQINFEPTISTEPFYFTIPALYPSHEYSVTNEAVALVAANMPNVMVQADLEVDYQDSDSNLDRPMLRFIDIATLGLGEAYSLARNLSYIDISEGKVDSNLASLSTFVNSEVSELSTLIWLAKFSGTQPITRFNFSPETLGDAFVLESSNLNSSNELRFTSYLELNPPALDVEAQKNLLRWQLDNGYYGKNAGTTDALIEATKLQLIDDKHVEVEYDYSTNPYEITIKTRWYETLGAIGPEVVGTSSNIVLESIEKAKPLATKVNHEFVA